MQQNEIIHTEAAILKTSEVVFIIVIRMLKNKKKHISGWDLKKTGYALPAYEVFRISDISHP